MAALQQWALRGHEGGSYAGAHVRSNRHLNGCYVPDAHGIQLLTHAHLANAHSLSDWVIETLSEGKHLVQARNLAPGCTQ